MVKENFALEVKAQQIRWAQEHDLAHCLEHKAGTPRWILSDQDKERNLYKSEFASLVRGREHKWFRALNSSQAFGVNLFAPLAGDEPLAKAVLQSLLPRRVLQPEHTVEVEFEFQAPDRTWMGELRGKQPTQVDVAFKVGREGVPFGYLLVEVKFSEALGTCRGYVAQRKEKENPSPCLNLAKIRADPSAKCRMARVEGRRYWELIDSADSSFQLNSLPGEAPCPFRWGGYQLMRNKVLADTLVKFGGAQWADVAICSHPGGRQKTLGDVREFRTIVGPSGLLSIEPADVVSFTVVGRPELLPWAEWFRDRYLSH
jgi:hypothetical protein